MPVAARLRDPRRVSEIESALRQPGVTLHNPRTGEFGRLVELTPERTVGEVVARPGGAVAAAHLHPRQEERFHVRSGVLGFRIGDRRGELRAGAALTVPAGTVHDWWNAGTEDLHAVVTVTPPGSFASVLGAAWGLAALGRTDERGVPGLLDAALLAEAFGQDLVFERPPVAVQRLLAQVVAPLARRLGRSVTSDEVLRAAVVPADAWPAAARAAAA